MRIFVPLQGERSAFALCLSVFWGVCWPLGASAQMALPGAVLPAPESAAQAPRAVAPKAKPSKPRPAAVTVPKTTSLAGKTLSLNGDKSQITFEPHATLLDVVRLKLAGELISNSRETCFIEAPNTPIGVTSLGRPNGVEQIRLDYQACPLTFDVLDGAMLVDRNQAVCEFKEANCRVAPAGLWGPTSGELGPDKQKAIERARSQAETAVRANFKALAASTKDRGVIAGYAKDQAQFPSTREETCRNYVGEERHGFCATKVTEARAASLSAALGTVVEAKAERKRKRAERQGRKP